jgi:hypothetical protein
MLYHWAISPDMHWNINAFVELVIKICNFHSTVLLILILNSLWSEDILQENTVCQNLQNKSLFSLFTLNGLIRNTCIYETLLHKVGYNEFYLLHAKERKQNKIIFEWYFLLMCTRNKVEIF